MDVISASKQLDDLTATLAGVEQQMIEASGDPKQFNELHKRHAALKVEIVRLQHGVKREQREAEQAHQTALADRRDEAREQAAKLRAAGQELDQKILATLADLEALLGQARELTKAHRQCAAASQGAIDALRKQYKVQGKPEVSSAWSSPDLSTTTAMWATATRWLAAVGVSTDHYAIMSAQQQAHHQKKRAG